MTENRLLAAALAYAAKGIHVFPLNGKRPAVRGGFHAATTDAQVITDWWSETADANIGIRTGAASGIWALDLDRKESGPDGWIAFQSLIPSGERLPSTPVQKTGNGFHIFFRCTSTPIGCNAGQVAPGIDVRGEGGYVVAAPSIHPVKMREYRWLRGYSIFEEQFAAAPAWLLERIASLRRSEITLDEMPIVKDIKYSSRFGLVALRKECERIESAAAGSQEVTLNKASFSMGRLIAGGQLLETDVTEQLTNSALRMISHDQSQPWKLTEIRAKIERSISHGKKNPKFI